MSTQSQINKFYQLSGLDVIESEANLDGSSERIEFGYKQGAIDAYGHFGFVDDSADFLVTYQMEDEEFDIEHGCDNGEEFVTFHNIDPYVGSAYVKDGQICRIEVSTTPVSPTPRRRVCVLTSKSGLRFLTPD